jgi:hypothetical protein
MHTWYGGVDVGSSQPSGAAVPWSHARQVYEITSPGRDELGRWFETPVPREVIPRQELAIKLVFAMRSGMADVAAVVQRQRVATVRALQDVTRLKAAAESSGDLAWRLMLDALVFQAEAEARWLDMCEARLAREDLAAGPARRNSVTPRRRPPAAGVPAGHPAGHLAGVLALTLLVIRAPLRRATRIQPGAALRYQ